MTEAREIREPKYCATNFRVDAIGQLERFLSQKRPDPVEILKRLR
jgi:hypothetical protein